MQASQVEGLSSGLPLRPELSEALPGTHGLFRMRRAGETDRQWDYRDWLQGDLRQAAEPIGVALVPGDKSADRGLADRQSERPLAYHLGPEIVASRDIGKDRVHKHPKSRKTPVASLNTPPCNRKGRSKAYPISNYLAPGRFSPATLAATYPYSNHFLFGGRS